MDKFDLSDLQDIKDITKKKIAISNFKQGDDMKKQENNKIIFWTRTLTSISACLIFSCGIVFSKTISTQIYDYAIAGKEELSINNGTNAKFSGEYSLSDEEIIDLENNNQGLSQDNIKIKVDNITMDDNNLEVIFNVELSEEISKKLNNARGTEIEFNDLLVTDENNNVLVGLNDDKVIELLNIDYEAEYKKNPDWEYENIKRNSIEQNEKYFGGNLHSFVLKYDGKNAKVVYRMNVVGKGKFYPRCKNLNLKIGKVKILNDMESDYGGTVLNYQGRWNFAVELPENIVNRTRTAYKMIENDNLKENKVLECNVLSSGTEIKLSLKAPEIMDNDTSPQLKLINALEVENPTTQIRDYFVDKLMASEEYKKYEDDLHKRYMIQDAYIEDETGKKYEGKKGEYSNFSGNITDEGFYEPTLMLNLTNQDVKENLKLHVKYCDIEYVFDLVKEGEI